MLSPLLYTLYTHDCTPAHSCNAIIHFADDTTVVELISGGDESAYQDEVEQLTRWCSNKTKELVIDFRRKAKADTQPPFIGGKQVERVMDFQFLWVHIQEDSTWNINTTTIIKKAQQRLYFLRVLRNNNLTLFGVNFVVVP